MHELVVNLSRAQSLRSMADTVANYCGKTFCSSAGMIFIERDGGLQMVSQWPAKQLPKMEVAEELIRKGPVARAFRSGEPSFWRQDRMPNSPVSRSLFRLLHRLNYQSVAFLPISAPGQRPVGVLAVILRDASHFVPPVLDELIRLSQIVAGCVVRARAYDAAIAACVKAENASRRKD